MLPLLMQLRLRHCYYCYIFIKIKFLFLHMKEKIYKCTLLKHNGQCKPLYTLCVTMCACVFVLVDNLVYWFGLNQRITWTKSISRERERRNFSICGCNIHFEQKQISIAAAAVAEMMVAATTLTICLMKCNVCV